MAKKIQQFRYYGDGNGNNYPSGISASNLYTGTIFTDYNCTRIVQLGIQTLPGMRVYINGNTVPIIVGQTGIYELSLDGMSYITELAFDAATLKLINTNQANSYLIIDVLHEVEGA